MTTLVPTVIGPPASRTLANGQGPALPIRAVLFDLDGTLYGQLPVRALMGLELLSLVVEKRSFRAAWRVWTAIAVFRRVREDFRVASSANGSLAELQYVETARRAHLDQREIEQWVAEWIFRRPLKYLRLGRRTGLRTFLRFLEDRGIRAGVLSDYPVADKLRALGLADRFSVLICATDPEVNAFKPHPAGFLRACDLWGLSPPEVLYVGDRPDTDAAGAAAAGMPCAIVSTFDWFRRFAGSTGPYLAVPFYGRLQRALNRSC